MIYKLGSCLTSLSCFSMLISYTHHTHTHTHTTHTQPNPTQHNTHTHIYIVIHISYTFLCNIFTCLHLASFVALYQTGWWYWYRKIGRAINICLGVISVRYKLSTYIQWQVGWLFCCCCLHCLLSRVEGGRKNIGSYKLSIHIQDRLTRCYATVVCVVSCLSLRG